jgi:phosphoribosylanthranilate isomerase
MTAGPDETLAREPETKVKICGLTNLDDAQAAAEMGAWAVGMIFYEGSPRRCSPEQGQVIAAALRRRVELCGVFVNAPLDQIVQLSETLGLTMVQLHGDEGPSFCEEVRRRSGVRVIKAKQVSVPAEVRDLERFHVDFHLVDAHARAVARAGMRGGTGETFDWSLLDARRSKLPLILSGGIDAGNAVAAIDAVHPYAIDSASGTEAAPGHKDLAKMAALFAAVRGAAQDPPGAARAGIGQPA